MGKSDGRDVQLLLVAKIVIDARNVHVGLGADLSHRGCAETQVRKNGACCKQYPRSNFSHRPSRPSITVVRNNCFKHLLRSFSVIPGGRLGNMPQSRQSRFLQPAVHGYLGRFPRLQSPNPRPTRKIGDRHLFCVIWSGGIGDRHLWWTENRMIVRV